MAGGVSSEPPHDGMLVYEEFESRVLVPVVYGRAMRLPSSIVLLSLVVGTTLLGFAGTLLALPVAAAILMLIEELRVELPGETEGMPAEQAAAVAVEMSDGRKREEGRRGRSVSVCDEFWEALT
jgi:hypothetical protein